jgi:hypothetical protein
MREHGISTSKRIEALLTDFGERNGIPVCLARGFGTPQEYVAGHMIHGGGVTWRIDLEKGFCLVLESREFPDHLVGELIKLADGLRDRLDEM